MNSLYTGALIEANRLERQLELDALRHRHPRRPRSWFGNRRRSARDRAGDAG